MEELFRFKALHKAMGGIETDVFVFDNKIELRRKVSGIISMNTKLPTETIAYYKDLTAINFVRPSLSSGNIGWIELVGISRDKNVTSTVDANWKMISNVDTVNGLKNPYNIAFNKNHREMEGYYNVSAKYSCGFPDPQVSPIIVVDRYLDYFTTIMEDRLWQVLAKPVFRWRNRSGLSMNAARAA